MGSSEEYQRRATYTALVRVSSFLSSSCTLSLPDVVEAAAAFCGTVDAAAFVAALGLGFADMLVRWWGAGGCFAVIRARDTGSSSSSVTADF